MLSSTIAFPATEWGDRDFAEMFPLEKYNDVNGNVREQPHSWELREPRVVRLKNLPDYEVREIVKQSVHLPQQSGLRIGHAKLSGLWSA